MLLCIQLEEIKWAGNENSNKINNEDDNNEYTETFKEINNVKTNENDNVINNEGDYNKYNETF